jgi:hypothetical protein
VFTVSGRLQRIMMGCKFVHIRDSYVVNYLKSGKFTFIVPVYSVFLLKLFTDLKSRYINRMNAPKVLPSADVSRPVLTGTFVFQLECHGRGILAKRNNLSLNTAPRGLRRGSAAACLLRWVRIPPGTWMSFACECCVLSEVCVSG